MSTIHIQNITYSYNKEINALKDIELTIESSKFFGVVGPNGSGKSTLLKCISGYIKPDTGCVTVDCRKVTTMRPKEIAKTMALVQQHASLDYEFAVQDIVLTGRNPYLKRMQVETELDFQITHEAMRQAEVLELKDRMVSELSGGEWQRMILARALALQAGIMLLDEPVSGLDIKHQMDFLKIAKSLSQNAGKTVVCVLHDLNLALNFCDHIAMLDSGHLYCQGEPSEVLTQKNIEHVYGIRVKLIKTETGTIISPQYSE